VPTSEFLASLELPQAISTVFPRFPELFPTVSSPSTLHSCSLPQRSPKLFPQFPARPRCVLAPAKPSPNRFHGFLSVPLHARCLLAPAFFQTASNPSYFQRFPIHPHSRSLPMELLSVHAACSLPPSETPPKLFPTVSNPTLNSRSQRGPPKLFGVHAACSFSPSAAPPSYFERFPFCP